MRYHYTARAIKAAKSPLGNKFRKMPKEQGLYILVYAKPRQAASFPRQKTTRSVRSRSGLIC
jgi:hypothetical protein